MMAFWIILTGALVAVSCGLLGCFLILRRMSMVGDAISHAVLPGIVISFLLSGSRETIPMLLGAGMTGLLATLIIEYFHRKRSCKQMPLSVSPLPFYSLSEWY
jgi:manganese/zinc/iron transport system permease protein